MEFKEVYTEMMGMIDEIDVQLDSLSGGKSAGKRKVTNQLIEKHEDMVSSAVTQIVSNLKNDDLSDAQVSALYSGIVQGLKDNFEERVNTYVNALVEQQPKQEPLISEDEAAVLSKQRSDLYQKVKAIVDIAASVGEGDLDMPKMRRGSSGKRGPRNLSLFTYFIDGEEVPEDKSIGQIAKENGYEKAADLTKALRSEVRDDDGNVVWPGFDTKDGDKFDDFKLPNGKLLSGFRDDEEDEEEEDEDETD